MRRFFESLRPADRSAIDSVPDGLFLVQMERAQYRWAQTEAVLPDPLRCSRAEASRRMSDQRPPLLHRKSNVEIDLVSARLRL